MTFRTNAVVLRSCLSGQAHFLLGVALEKRQDYEGGVRHVAKVSMLSSHMALECSLVLQMLMLALFFRHEVVYQIIWCFPDLVTLASWKGCLAH